MSTVTIAALVVIVLTLAWSYRSPSSAEETLSRLEKGREVFGALFLLAAIYVFVTTGGIVYTVIGLFLIAGATLWVAVNKPHTRIA